jgi:hypothetical protein
MSVRRSYRKLISLPLGAAALAVSASSLFAQSRPLFDWSGRVDREVRITMHGRDARALTDNRFPMQRSRLDVASALPDRDGRVSVRLQDGRGDAQVVQQPNARNDYTAIVRVTDRSAGVDNYHLTAYWEPDRYNDGYGNRDDRGGWDRGRDNPDNNGGWGRGNGNGGYGNGGYGNGGNGRGMVEALRWSGDVDDALEIRIQGNRVDYRTMSGKNVRNVRANLVNGGLPRSDVQVFVNDQSGRGSVSVVQQPSSYNNYTTVIRVYDPNPGYGGYSFDIGYRDNYRR